MTWRSMMMACTLTATCVVTAYAADTNGAPQTASSAEGLFVDVTAVRQSWPTLGDAWVNFKREMERQKITGALDVNSIRVCPVSDAGVVSTEAAQSRFVPITGFNESANPVGRVIWQVAGDGIPFTDIAVDDQGYVILKSTKARQHLFQSKYRVFFGLKGKAAQATAANNSLPDHGEFFPNGGFEETSKAGVPDQLFYFNPAYMSLDTEVVHSGKNSLRLNPHREDKGGTVNITVLDLRVEGGRNYIFSFWSRAQGTDTNCVSTSSIYWFDRNREPIKDETGRQLESSVMNPQGYMTTDYTWQCFENIIEAPKNACFAAYSTQTYTLVGHVWLDDMSARVQVLSDDPIEAERMKIETTSYRELAQMLDVSGEVVTPHMEWAKPYAAGKIKTLYLAFLRKDTDATARFAPEFAQRLDMDYTFMPILKHRIPGQSVWSTDFTDDLEPYTLALLKQKLQTKYDLIVVDRLDFKGVQKEFVDPLLAAAANGAGILFLDCTNLPPAVQAAMAKKVDLPANFSVMPELNGTVASMASQFCQLATYEKGRLAVMPRVETFFPCVPDGQVIFFTVDLNATQFPGWEYQHIPWIKTMLWLTGKPVPVRIAGAAVAKDKLNLTLDATPPAGSVLELALRDSFGRRQDPVRTNVPPDAGKSLTVSLPKLPRGKHIAEYRLLDAAGKVMDFGATNFFYAGPCSIDKLALDKRTYRHGEPIKLQASFSEVPTGSNFVLEVWDTLGRLVLRQSIPLTPAQGNVKMEFSVPEPLTITHRAFVKVVQDSTPVAEAMTEFSTPDNYPSNDEITACLWPGGAYFAPGGLMAFRNAGFDEVMVSASRLDVATDALVHANLRPIGYDLDMGPLNHKGVGQYSGNDTIRDPCFSNPAFWKHAEESARTLAPKLLYYGARDCLLSDELEIGPCVCFCPYCLARFRESLKTIYPSLDALNAEWGTTFKNWEEVKPYTLKETQEKKAKLASWLDHRMFMTQVFAEMIGHVKAIYRPVFPEIHAGLSGTQVPNYSYNWTEFLKYADFNGTYGGIQDDLIRSFKQPGMRNGQWAGGYAYPWDHAEKYERVAPWDGLFAGRCCYDFFHGSSCWGSRGDLRMNSNTQMALEELAVIRGGIDKLILSTPAHKDGVAMHYSHPSLFAGIATDNERAWRLGLDSWKYLLDDLGLGFTFVSAGQIEKGQLQYPEYKVIILPVSFCLSTREVAGLTEFARSGGTVIADYAPGFFNEHGNPFTAPELSKLFGIERTGTAIQNAAGELAISETPSLGLKARAIPLRYAEEGLRLTTGKACATFGGKPALILNEVGKGKTLLLNCVMHEYAKTEMLGGGETQLVGRGDPALTGPMREMVAGILAANGIRPPVKVTMKNGANFQPLMNTHIYDAGALRYVGFLKVNSDSKPILPEERIPVVVDFGQVSHVYDVKAGKYLGNVQKIDTVIAPSIGQLFALLPYKVQSVAVTCPEAVRGEKLTASIAVNAQGDVGRHVATVRFYAPDGHELAPYRTKVILEKGRGSIAIRTALNDPAGAWKVQATDIASGVIGETVATVK